MGRCGVGAGEGITGFSVSLPWSDTSVLLLSRCPHSGGLLPLTLVALHPGLCCSPGASATCPRSPAGRGGSRRGTLGTSAPVDDLGFVDLVARIVDGRQAGGVADRAVDIANGTARPADDVVVVVQDPRLVARD